MGGSSSGAPDSLAAKREGGPTSHRADASKHSNERRRSLDGPHRSRSGIGDSGVSFTAMTEAIEAKELAARVCELVERFDGGDVSRAARHIGAREADLRAILTAQNSHPSLAALSAIVRGYDVDAWW